MKKTYLRPASRTFLLASSALMVGGSCKVNEYSAGTTINVGDTDEASGAHVREHRNYVDWDK